MSEKSNKVENWGATWRFYWKFAGPTFRKVWWCFLLLPLIVAVALVEPSVYRLIVDELTKTSQGAVGIANLDMGKLFGLLLFWAGVNVFNLAIMSTYRLYFSYHMPEVERTYTEHLFRIILQKDLKMHLEKKSGEMMKEVDRAVDYIWQISYWMYAELLIAWLTLLAVMVYAFSVSWQMSLVMLITLPLFLFNILYIARKTHSKQWEVFQKYDKAYGHAYDAVANIMTVKSFSKEEFEHKRFHRLITSASEIQRRISMWWGGMSISSNFAFILTRMMIFAGGVFFISRGDVSVGTMIMFLSFSGSVYSPIQQLGDQMRNFQRGMLAIEKARKILEAKNEVNDIPEAKPLRVTAGKIEFEKISFTYKDKQVLKDVDLQIRPGSSIALVGHSGAGKSTIVSLLNRFYNLPKGKILIDGQDIAKVTQRSLREALGLVMQDNTLFNATILNNIRYAKPNASRKEVIAAAKQANIHDFIMTLPDKYETKVGERGLKLSGGEKQRVAIARMILKNPPIVILDEATSALDSANEKIIQAALEKLMKGRTAIVIAHRLSTVRKVDQIVVIDKGKIVQKGSHGELMKEEGVYKDLVDLQVGGLLAP